MKKAFLFAFSVFFIMAISTCALAFPIPDTGQTKSYTNIFGEDSNYETNPLSYTKLDADGNALLDSAPSWSMVKDNATGLIWEGKTDDGSIHDKDNKYNWDNAQSVFIANLNATNYGGFSDWRLPTVKELSSILNSGTYNPAINTAYFPNTMSSYYWSSTTNAIYTAIAWCVDFYDGYVGDGNKSYALYVRAVRGGQSGPLDHLVINGDGTVTDTFTGLRWQQQTAGPMMWEAAISYCEGLSLGGYNDWRLPNINELQSLMDYTRYIPAIDPAVFKDTKSSGYWSSTTDAYDTSYAWCVDFYIGYVYYSNKSRGYYVRAVRGGHSGHLDNLVIIADHTPSGGASMVALDTVVTVTFNKSMDQASTEAAFSITPAVSDSITWADDEKTLTFTPASNLSPGVEYTVSIASSATDTGGHKLDSNQNGIGGEAEDTSYTFTFATVPVLPDTGQTQRYTDTFGEDSDYTINTPSYTKLDAQGNALPDSASSWSMVKDNATGLMWEGKTDDGSIHDKDDTYNWDNAQSVFIAKLNAENYGGFSDWRLPTVKELSSLVNSGTYNPAINTAYFLYTMSSYYWSSATFGFPTSYYAWCVRDVVVGLDKPLSLYVRAVRGGQSGPLDHLVINGDGTVTDNSTGLIWQQQKAGPMTWEEAISYCEGLSLGGYNDWRLPNRNELQSLVDYTCYHPAIDRVAFPSAIDRVACPDTKLELSCYWSSTTDASHTSFAWYVDFSYGRVEGGNKSISYYYYVRAVRGGQSGTLKIYDGKDNDSDGKIDEDLTQPCSTACGKGTETCQNGKWVNCTAPQPQAEVCDGKDNDCDGKTDEDLTQTCSTACGKGTETCQNGKWVNCNAPQPQTEVFNDKDDNCDGQIDEGLLTKCSEDDSGVLDIKGTNGAVGDTVRIPIKIQSAPNAVTSLYFKVAYDPAVLEFTGFERGGLVKSFAGFEVRLDPDNAGKLRAGGYTAENIIPQGASGDLVYLKFTVKGGQENECYSLRVESLTGYIAGFSSSRGCFCISSCNGDINEDGETTPADALAAFKCYFGSGPCSECCDVNKDGSVTPADALCLFTAYLGQHSCLDN